MQKIISCFISFLLLPSMAVAYILPTRIILDKVTENAGKGVYAIEQEITFQHTEAPITVKETWLIESDRSMRLTINLPMENGQRFQVQNIYLNNQKSFMANKSRSSEVVSNEFLERYFNARNPDALANLLTQHKILPAGAMQKKALPSKVADIKYHPEPWVRYARSQGVVNYAFGIATPVDKAELYPGLWVEQDQFVIRKIRFPSQAEVTANDYNSFSKNLYFPKNRIVRWDNHLAEIKLLSASARPKTAAKQISTSSIELDTNWEALKDHPAREMIMEFYKRFR